MPQTSKIDAVMDAITALCDGVSKMTARLDDHRVVGGAQLQPTAAQINNTLGMRFDALVEKTKAIKG